MSTTYVLALNGLKTNEEYVDKITKFLDNHDKTYIVKNNYVDGLSIYNNYMTIFLHFEDVDVDYYKKHYNFDANIEFSIYFFSERYEAGIELLLELISHLERLGVNYFFQEGSAFFKKENGKLTFSHHLKDKQYYLNEETIRRFLE